MSDNPAVANLLNNLGGDAVSPEIAGFVGNAPPIDYIPPPEHEYRPKRTFGGADVDLGDKPLSKAESKELIDKARIANVPTGSYKRFGELAKLVDTNARVRVMKRLPNGQLSHIEDYAKRDVETLGDIVAFLNKWIKPQRGGGTYEISLVDPKGVELHAGAYHLDGPDIDPAKGPASINGNPAFGENATLLLMRDMLNRPQPLLPDPIEQMQKAQKLMDSFAPKTPPQNNDILVMMMQMQQASQQQMMAILTQKPSGPDPVMLLMLEEIKKLSAAPPPPPPPPPMMPQTPAYSVPELISAVAAAASVFIPLLKGDGGIKPMELVAMMQGAQQQTQTMMATLMGDRLTAKDMLAIQRDQNSGTPTLVDQMQQLAAVKQFASELSPAPAGPQGTTFWDAVVTLVGNPMVAEGLGSRIAKGGDAAAPQSIAVEDRGRPTKADTRPTKADPAIPPSAPPQEEQMPFPENFGPLCKAIEDAPDDSVRAEAIFEAIKSLQPFPQWRQFCEGLLVALAKDEQARAVGGLGTWLSVLARLGHLSSAAADRALSTFDRNFAIIRQYALEKWPVLRQFAPQAPAAPPTPPVETKPAETKPVVGAAPEENGHEEATGPAPVDVELPGEYE